MIQQKMQNNKIEKKIKPGYIYESRWTINECFYVFQLALLLSVSSLIVEASISTYVICSILLSVLGWQFVLRKSYFYDHYMIVFFPLRLCRRKIIIHYDKVYIFMYRFSRYEGEYLFIKQDDNFLFFKNWFYSSRVTPKCKKGRFSFYYLLKYFKQQGYLIQTNKLYPREKHIELVFGTGVSDYIRKSPYKKKTAHKDHIRRTIITFIFFILLFFLFYWYLGTLD